MPTIDLAALAAAMAVIIGIVNGIALFDQAYAGEGQKPRINSFVKFILAVALGILFGFLGWFGLTVQLGLVAALASSGLYKLTQNI